MYNSPIVYVLLNGSLKMSPGKAAAQAVHAVGSLNRHHGIRDWSDRTQRTVIILEAENAEQMNTLEIYLDELNIPAESYIDEGVNEITPYSVTALAIGPIYADEHEKREILKPFPLFPRKTGLFR